MAKGKSRKGSGKGKAPAKRKALKTRKPVARKAAKPRKPVLIQLPLVFMDWAGHRPGAGG